MFFSIPVLLTVLAAPLALAQTACTGQQYNDLPGFPASNSGCYPLNYYRSTDLGSTNPDDARSRCQQQCTSDSSCSSVVAQVNKAADSNLYSGTCFFYTTGSDPNGPRSCANTAYLLEGYKKDSSLACFSTSSAVASSFCSSYLHIPLITSTVTNTPLPVTTTLTSTTSPTTTATVTTTTTSITSATVTNTNTVSATTTVPKTVTTTVTTTVSTTTISSTATVMSTITSTATATTSTVTTTTAATNQKRGLAIRATSPTPACITPGTPASRLSAACSCLSVSTSTTTTTTTLQPITSSRSITVTSSVTSTSTSTQTIVNTVPVTIGTSVTVTSATFTSTATTTSTSSVTATTSTVLTTTSVVTTTTTTTKTLTSTATAEPTLCSSAQNSFCNSGSGSNGVCRCGVKIHTTSNICFTTAGCYRLGQTCNNDADCTGMYGQASYATCVYNTGLFGDLCTSSTICVGDTSNQCPVPSMKMRFMRDSRQSSADNVSGTANDSDSVFI